MSRLLERSWWEAAELRSSRQPRPLTILAALTVASGIFGSWPAAVADEASSRPGHEQRAPVSPRTSGASHQPLGSANAKYEKTFAAGRELIFSNGFEAGNYFSWSRAFIGSADATPPELDILSPPRVLYNDPSPPLEFSFSDSGDGIAPGSFSVVLDGADLTGSCTVTASTASCPNPSLTPGAHPLVVTVWDLAGNRQREELEVHLVEDTAPPELSITDPVFEILYRPQIEIGAGFLDFESGIVRDSVRIFLNGTDLTSTCALSFTSARCDPVTLTPGPHEVQAEVEDAAGNRATVAHVFTLVDDVTPPSLTISRPENRTYVNDSPRLVRFEYLDTESGVDPEAAVVILDGVDVTTTCRRGSTSGSCPLESLPDGEHLVEVRVVDYQGNQVQTTVPFRTATNAGPPVVTFLEPAQGEILTATPVTIRARVVDDNVLDSVFLNGDPVTLVGDELSVSLDRPNGAAQYELWAFDEFGRRGSETVNFEVDIKPPTLNVREPRDGTIINQAQVLVRGTTSDSNGPPVVTVAGNAVPVDGVWFETLVDLSPGENVLVVTTTDQVGHSQQTSVTVTRVDPPKVAVTSPLPDTLVLGSTVSVLGSISDPAATVTVNGVPAAVTGESFEAIDVPLAEGATVLTTEAVSGSGLISTASVTVLRDIVPPRLTVYSPETHSTVSTASVAVSGLVNDIVPGTVTGADVTVTVNGLPAAVANRSFLATEVPLSSGSNPLEVEATDASGNITRRQLFVTRDDQPGARVERFSGDAQQSSVRTALPEELKVRVTDDDGLGQVGQHVIFEVVRNDGHFPGGLRRVSRVTDEQGEASVAFTLGGRAGAGLPIVQARAPELSQAVTFVATSTPGAPAHLIADAGNNQVGITEQPLAESLVATVTDEDFNRLAGVPVRFVVAEGGGSFNNGSADLTLMTDESGRAIVVLTLGAHDGLANNVVEVTLPESPEVPAAGFFASGRAAGLPEDTIISGVVLDNTDEAVPGVTVSLSGTSLTTQTDASGYFELTDAPVGIVHLLVDGSTTSRPGTWPVLDFVLMSVPGRTNRLPSPIYLLPFDVDRGLPVSEVDGGILEIPEIPGLSLLVEPGSVTFPDGGRSGTVSVTAVHSDKVPMPPNFAQQPRLILTIQPAGAVFDPPARLTLPNTDSLSPGAVTELYSFDHDLGRFVSIGPATVTEDGSAVVSNPGVGILKAGWHCGGNPAPTGTPHDCPVCKKCSGIRCVPALECLLPQAQREALGLSGDSLDCDCDNLNPCLAITCNGAGECIEDEEGPDKEVRSVELTVEGEKDYEGEYDPSEDLLFVIQVDAKNCIPEVKVNFDDGISQSASQIEPGIYAISHGYIREGQYTVKAEAYCPECQEQEKQMDSATVDLYKVAIKLEAGETVISEDGKYTEDTPIIATAVRRRDGSTIESFAGVVGIQEISPTPIYSQNISYGAGLSTSIQIIKGGVGESIARSLAESQNGAPPDKAILEVTSHPPYDPEPLTILQWIQRDNLDPGRSREGKFNFDWFEARVRDLYEAAAGDLATISAAAMEYEQSDVFTGDSLREAETDHFPGGTSLVRINPLAPGFRVEKGEQAFTCNIQYTTGLVGAVYHEWRHAYQWSLVHQDIGIDDGGPGASNSDDGDQLVDVVPVAPSQYLLDTREERPVCNIDTNPPARESQTQNGDSIFDTNKDPDWTRYVVEMDAYEFEASHNAGQPGLAGGARE